LGGAIGAPREDDGEAFWRGMQVELLTANDGRLASSELATAIHDYIEIFTTPHDDTAP
jgi:hypothetical protein